MSSSASKQTEFVMSALDRFERPLTRYVTRLLGGDSATAADVIQHAFLKLCEQDRESLVDRVAPWLYTVCRNRAVDELRGRNSHEQLDDTWFNENSQSLSHCGSQKNGHAALENPAAIVEQADFFNKLQTLIDDLPNSQREIVELWSQGFTSNEMCEVTGKRSGAIRIALHRALKQLRRHESVRRWLGEIDDETLPFSSRPPSPFSERT